MKYAAISHCRFWSSAVAFGRDLRSVSISRPQMYSLQMRNNCCASEISCLFSTTSNVTESSNVCSFSIASVNLPPVVN